MITRLLRLVRKAKQLGLFEGMDVKTPASRKRRQVKPRARYRQPAIEAPEQNLLVFAPNPHTLKDLRAVIGQLKEWELPSPRKEDAAVAVAMRDALVRHPKNASAAVNAMRRALVKQGYAEAKARQIAVTEIRTAVNGLLHEYAKRYARENGVSLVKRWKHNDALVKTPRCKHKALNGVAVPIDEPFTLQGADGVVYYPQYPHDGILPAGETINCQCTFEIVKVNKMNKTEILKAILHNLQVWKKAYRVGDRRNTRGFWEVKYRNAKRAGADNWRPLRRMEEKQGISLGQGRRQGKVRRKPRVLRAR
jgi:hypothetical protein